MAVRRAASAFYRDTSHETAAALLEVALRHPHELARVSAAASYVQVTTDPAKALAILERGVRSRDRLTRNVAATALGRFDPRNPALAPLLEARRRRSRLRRSRTALLVHGTWARTQPWWQPPSGDFWSYYHAQVDPTLYGAADRFEWSGGYSDAARALAGSDLHAWVDAHTLDGLDLIGHSHGGNVIMLANHAGTHVGRMILLSCPVRWPKYTPDFTRVGRVISIRVHLDLVILVDGGGQRFNDSRIEEHVLPLWFDHFATHDPATWQQFNVPAML
jgi:pimeloyl-ACP methyl ester carboxylesterase